MEPDERRAAIVDATLPLLVEHGAAVTTGQIATAAGVAEGTVFRAFVDKHELLWACLDAAVDPAQPVAALAEIPRNLPLSERLHRACGAVAEHWDRAMQVGHAVCTACARPPADAATHAVRKDSPRERARCTRRWRTSSPRMPTGSGSARTAPRGCSWSPSWATR